MRDVVCASCDYYAPFKGMAEYPMLGECRYDLPQAQGIRERAKWARTYPNDWCRQWKARKPDDPDTVTA